LLTVAKKNAALSFTLRELERAQRELQDAHDTLEQKVIERSAPLQVEMTARKSAELQFKAVLAERTRLARDLHDSLEQTLTGIALQLDTAAKLFERNPAASNHHLELARNWLRQSQVELRRSIWDLRTRELEQFDLANALRQSAEHLVDGTTMQLEFTTRGEKRALPEVVEENTLRIGQEALTNIAKHAQASRVNITLEFGPRALMLLVEDNGIGFVSPTTPAPGDNHFGLLGMSERAKRLGGQVVIDSVRGRGTAIEVEIPIDPLRSSPSPIEPGAAELRNNAVES
jgi:signal transduction histidine kinase